MPSGQSGTIEFNISNGNNEGYGGDFVRTPYGDLQLVADGPVTPIVGTGDPLGYPNTDNLQPSPTQALATNQRLTRMFFTTPVLYDSGVPLNYPDDKSHPTWGMGAPALVDEDSDFAQNVLTNNFNKQIKYDPAVAQPASITFQEDDDGNLLTTISAPTITGQPAATPSLPLTAALLGGT